VFVVVVVCVSIGAANPTINTVRPLLLLLMLLLLLLAPPLLHQSMKKKYAG